MKDMFADSECDFLLFSGSGFASFVKSVIFQSKVHSFRQKGVNIRRGIILAMNKIFPLILRNGVFSGKQ